MISQNAEFQAKMYLYDLHNCARENGFKADDKWEVSLATDDEKTAIENMYNPIIAVKVAPAVLSEMFSLVKENLNLPKTDIEKGYNTNVIYANQLHYLVAFTPKRVRR